MRLVQRIDNRSDDTVAIASAQRSIQRVSGAAVPRACIRGQDENPYRLRFSHSYLPVTMLNTKSSLMAVLSHGVENLSSSRAEIGDWRLEIGDWRLG